MRTFGRSRLGDFLVCGAAGLILLAAVAMMTHLPLPAAIAVYLIYVTILFFRYYTLRDAPAVPVGVNVEAEYRDGYARLRALVNALPQPVMLLDRNGDVENFNPACVELFGEEMKGRHITSIIRAPAALEAYRLVRATGKPAEVEFTTPGVNERTHLFYAAPLDENQEQRVVLMLRDRTEQKRLERMRTDFVANASHELRTPLASLGGFIETLQGHARDDPQARSRFLGIMSGQVERMLRLVEDLIGLSTLELNEHKLPNETVDLANVAKSVCESLMPVAEKRGVRLNCVVADGLIEVIGDRHELFRLVQNLCDNAMKYGVDANAADPAVTIRVGGGAPPVMAGALRSGDTASQIAIRSGIDEDEIAFLRVEDQGPGIEPTDLPRLTERFYRVNPELSRSKGGTGLGLAIVKHVLQRHRAGLQIESAEGRGSAFTCFFGRRPERANDTAPQVKPKVSDSAS